MNKLIRVEICVNNNKLTHKDYQWYTKEYSNWIQEDRKIKYEIQDNGKNIKGMNRWINVNIVIKEFD